jgi:hypothetical protein
MVRNKSSLLIDEPPLMVLPTLAAAIGLNEAIFVQQLHWLLVQFGKPVKGQEGRWVYNTITEWREKYPFWSERTIKRIVKELKEKGVLRVGRFNKMAIDQTRWYSLDYEKLNTYSPIVTEWPNREGQNGPIPSGQDGPMTSGQNGPLLPENKTTNQREKTPANDTRAPSEHQAIIDSYIDELGYRPAAMGREGKWAKWLVANHYSPTQVIECYRHLKRDKYWRDKFVSLQKVAEQIAEVAGCNGHAPAQTYRKPTQAEIDAAHSAPAIEV